MCAQRSRENIDQLVSYGTPELPIGCHKDQRLKLGSASEKQKVTIQGLRCSGSTQKLADHFMIMSMCTLMKQLQNSLHACPNFHNTVQWRIQGGFQGFH